MVEPELVIVSTVLRLPPPATAKVGSEGGEPVTQEIGLSRLLGGHAMRLADSWHARNHSCGWHRVTDFPITIGTSKQLMPAFRHGRPGLFAVGYAVLSAARIVLYQAAAVRR
jgi:hypothetical protein